MSEYNISFEPVGLKGQCDERESILDCARRSGLGLNNVCGGRGTCHTCKIRILSGDVSESTSNEAQAFTKAELKQGWRLACQVHPRSDTRVNVPADSMTTAQRLQVEGVETVISPEPAVKAFPVRMEPPTLSDTLADADRLLAALNRRYGPGYTHFDIDVLRNISSRLREWDWECRAMVRNNEVIAIGSLQSRRLGFAVDIGSTKIAGYLVDLDSGKTLAARGVMNPQVAYGDDIISRISATLRDPEGGAPLRKLVVDALNELAWLLCKAAGADVEDILDTVVVGNTAMHHLFLGLPVEQLALAPFVAAEGYALDLKSRDASLNLATGSYVHLLPNIAGFIGADHVSMLLATEAYREEGPAIALDIGTNTEVSLIHRGKISSVSCASGPAFEGGHIKFGMRATRGAIEKLVIVDGQVQYQTIDGAPPVGICGSGILDAVSQLYLARVIDEGGRMHNGNPRVQGNGRGTEFVLVEKNDEHPAISITQQDIRELQLGKAAIRAGIQTLLDTQGCQEKDIKKVIIAGAFGSYIDVASAVTIGMLPNLPLDCFEQVGNAAGMGAKLALISVKKRDEAREIASKINYVELAGSSGFMAVFLQASYLGRYRIINGKRRGEE
jgi:uncharacterized 2Fe-2S/4Fe-4S cluster protein (DUF4445 family)